MAGSRPGVPAAGGHVVPGHETGPGAGSTVAPGWRREFPVMVAEAQAIGSVGVIRSLGRAGYPVHAVAASSDALGLESRFAAQRVVSPAYLTPGFIPWLQRYIRDFGIRVIVPSEGFLFAIRDAWGEFAHLMPIPSDRQVVFRALSKYEFFERLAADVSLWRNVPPTLFVRDELPPESEYAKLPFPVFLKADRCHSHGSADGDIVRTVSTSEARRRTAELLQEYDRVLVQGFVPGTKPGEYLLLWDGQVSPLRQPDEPPVSTPGRGWLPSPKLAPWGKGPRCRGEAGRDGLAGRGHGRVPVGSDHRPLLVHRAERPLPGLTAPPPLRRRRFSPPSGRWLPRSTTGAQGVPPRRPSLPPDRAGRGRLPAVPPARSRGRSRRPPLDGHRVLPALLQSADPLGPALSRRPHAPLARGRSVRSRVLPPYANIAARQHQTVPPCSGAAGHTSTPSMEFAAWRSSRSCSTTPGSPASGAGSSGSTSSSC